MLVIAIAVLVAIAQAQDAHAATRRANAARRRAAALLTAKSQADDAAEKALAELAEVRVAAAKAVTDAQEAAEAAIQRAIADAHAQLKTLQDQAVAAKAEAEQLAETLRAELAGAASVATHAELNQPIVPTPAQAGLATIRARGRSGRHTKMTPALVDKAQRMYDSGHYTVPEIAKSCAVSLTTIYRHIRTGRATAH